MVQGNEVKERDSGMSGLQKAKDWEVVFHNLCKLRALIEIMNGSDFSQHSPHVLQTYT